MRRIYFDVCCLNRPFDDQSQDRIRLESEAVLLILSHLESGDWQWVGSEVIAFEIDQTPDSGRRSKVKLLTAGIQHTIMVEQQVQQRAEQLQDVGFDALDALHVACAENGGAEVFLTTDEKLLRVARRISRQLKIKVENPLDWLKVVSGQ